MIWCHTLPPVREGEVRQPTPSTPSVSPLRLSELAYPQVALISFMLTTAWLQSPCTDDVIAIAYGHFISYVALLQAFLSTIPRPTLTTSPRPSSRLAPHRTRTSDASGARSTSFRTLSTKRRSRAATTRRTAPSPLLTLLSSATVQTALTKLNGKGWSRTPTATSRPTSSRQAQSQSPGTRRSRPSTTT